MSEQTGSARPTLPFVVTLAFDPALQDRLERDRRRFFPEQRNIVPAHVSLFHHLPGEAEDQVVGTLREVCASTTPFNVLVDGVIALGRGTAYRLRVDARLHTRLAAAWRDMLTRQDSQGWRPHVTIQNKVQPQEAQALQRRLSAGFEAFGGRAEAVRLWRYVGGPWEPVQTFVLGG